MLVNVNNTEITFAVPYEGDMVTCIVLAEALRHITKSLYSSADPALSRSTETARSAFPSPICRGGWVRVARG